MTEPLNFEDIHVGEVWRSPARTITEADIVHFAGSTGDYDPLHVDHEFAGASMYGKPIAHGLLGLSFLAGLSSRSPWMCNIAFTEIRQWRFLKPIYIGDTVSVMTEVSEMHDTGRRRGRVVWRRQLVNQDGIVVQEGILETLVATRCGQRSDDRKGSDVVPPPHATRGSSKKPEVRNLLPESGG